MIGAILPQGGRLVLKVAGAPAAMDSHLKPFGSGCVRSISWTTSRSGNCREGLARGTRPGHAIRHVADRRRRALELTVIPLPIPEDDPDYVLSNVNRWRQQLQLGPLTAPQLGEQAEKIQVGGAVATLVDLRAKRTQPK